MIKVFNDIFKVFKRLKNPYCIYKQVLTAVSTNLTSEYVDCIVSLTHAFITFKLTKWYLMSNKLFLKYSIFSINSSLYFNHDIQKYNRLNMLYLHHIISSLILLCGLYRSDLQRYIILGTYNAELSNFAILITQILFKSDIKKYINNYKSYILFVELTFYGYYRLINTFFILKELWSNAQLMLLVFGTLIYIGGIVWTSMLLKQYLFSIRILTKS